MQINETAAAMPLWAVAFSIWILVYMYGFWQLVRSAQAKQKIAYMWLGFLIVWVMPIPLAVMIKEFM